MIPVLRDYQKTTVDRMLWCLNIEGNSLISLPTGAGKSVVIAEFIKRIGTPILLFCPSRELLEQDYEKLSHVIPRENIGIFSASKKTKEVNTITIATIQSAYKHPQLFNHYKVILIDECFVSGTKIDDKNIEDIKIGDYVNSYNHKTKKIEKKKVIRTFKKAIHPLYDPLYLTNLNGISTLSTGNHPFYIKEKGYIPARQIKKGDTAYAIKIQPDKRTSMFEVWKDRSSKKLPSVLEIQKKWKVISQNVRKGIDHKLYKTSSNETSRKTSFYRNASENKQYNEKKRNKTINKKGKWFGSNTNGGTSNVSTWKRLAAFYFTYKEEKGGRISISLQNRLSESNSKNSDRSRWWEPQSIIKKITRQKETTTLRELRVESIKIQEQADKKRNINGSGYCYVYNIEVEDNNNYFANGVLVHNCSGVNPKNVEGMYNKFFKEIGNPKIIGLDATCFRLDSFYRSTGKPWQPWESVTTTKILTRYKERFWKQFVAVINTHQLIEAGYLCPLVYKDMSFFSHEDIPTNVSQSDFDLKAFEELINDREEMVVKTIVSGFTVHKSILVFCSSIEQAERLSQVVKNSSVVSSKTPAKERERIINDFKSGELKVVFNVNCLTRGFDHPSLDAIVMVRPTRSINLYCQMLGRGTRLAEGKTECTVYDFAGNLKGIGPLESVKMEKIENKWNVTTQRFPQGAHLKELYSFKISSYRKEAEYEQSTYPSY